MFISYSLFHLSIGHNNSWHQKTPVWPSFRITILTVGQQKNFDQLLWILFSRCLDKNPGRHNWKGRKMKRHNLYTDTTLTDSPWTQTDGIFFKDTINFFLTTSPTPLNHLRIKYPMIIRAKTSLKFSADLQSIINLWKMTIAPQFKSYLHNLKYDILPFFRVAC